VGASGDLPGGGGSDDRSPSFEHDLALRRGIRNCDMAAWERFALDYHVTLCRQAARILPRHMDPEDAAGETWRRALAAARTYDPRRSPYPWLARICVNVCLEQRRRERRSIRWLAGFRAERCGRPRSQPPSEASEVNQALLELTPREREIITLRYVFNVSPDEIAILLRMKPETVRRTRRRGMAHLRKRLIPRSQDAPSTERRDAR